jgi:hypothetical protein
VDPRTMAGTGMAGVGIAGGIINNLMNDPSKGYEKAGQEMERYYRDAQGNLQPYNQNGMSQFDRLTGQADALNDPATLQNKWAQSYQMSPQAQQQLAQAKTAGMGAASSMGLLGSSAAVNNIQNSAGNIMQNDRQSYMNDLMQKYMASVGIGQNLYGVGASAAGTMSNNAMQQGQNMAQAKYGEENAQGEQWGKLFGGMTNAGINYASGGVK